MKNMTMLLRTLVIAAVATMFVNMAMAANYTVGAPNGGWDLQTSLQAWANSNTFVVGDSLTFVYGTTTHNVLQVSKTDYDACQTNSPVASYAGGNTVISLTSSGQRYYICGTPGHCDGGMKVVISTLAASPPPQATPSVPPAATPSAPPPATPSAPPPATPLGSPTGNPVSSPVASPPRTAAPTKSPKLSPSVSPSKSPVSSPSKSPAISPASSSTTPTAESPAIPPFPDASPPSTTPSSANKINVVTGFTMGVGSIIMMLLTL